MNKSFRTLLGFSLLLISTRAAFGQSVAVLKSSATPEIVASIHDDVQVPKETLLRAEEVTSSSFTVHVSIYARVDSKTLAEAEKSATEIFRHAGVEMRWADQAMASPVEIKHENADSQPSLGLSHLWVVILPHSMAEVLGLPGNVMGVAPGIGPERDRVYVFYDCLEAAREKQVLAMRKGDINRAATRGQILGHVIAHEIGHLLLNLPSHSASGIMRGDWDPKDLQDAAFGRLLFTRPQTAVLRTEVARRAEQSAVNFANQREVAH